MSLVIAIMINVPPTHPLSPTQGLSMASIYGQE